MIRFLEFESLESDPMSRFEDARVVRLRISGSVNSEGAEDG